MPTKDLFSLRIPTFDIITKDIISHEISLISGITTRGCILSIINVTST